MLPSHPTDAASGIPNFQRETMEFQGERALIPRNLDFPSVSIYIKAFSLFFAGKIESRTRCDDLSLNILGSQFRHIVHMHKSRRL